jgi:hypothetical protein
MSTYLNELIERVKREINQERKRVDHITFHTKRRETLANGTLRRLEQRIEVLELLRVKGAVTKRSSPPADRRRQGRMTQVEALKRPTTPN